MTVAISPRIIGVGPTVSVKPPARLPILVFSPIIVIGSTAKSVVDTLTVRV